MRLVTSDVFVLFALFERPGLFQGYVAPSPSTRPEPGYGSSGTLINLSTHGCAMIVSLPPGSYTIVVEGVDASAGIALVEAYELPPS